MEGGLLFYSNRALLGEVFPKKPLGLIFLNSLRDLKLEERNGQIVKIKGKPHYIEGSIERIVRETKPGGLLHGLIEVKGVVVDDFERDLLKLPTLPLLPEVNRPWLHPLDLRTNEDILLSDITWNIQSDFRKLPKDYHEARKRSKYFFERKVSEKLKEVGGDIILSDSFMARIEFLIRDFGLYGKVLNIHPAPSILGREFCFRGKLPVSDAINFARANGGSAYTGATLHLVNEEIDDGLPIAYACNTFVSGSDSVMSLIQRNYANAKLPLLVAGLRHYVLSVFPHLDEIPVKVEAQNWFEVGSTN